MLPTSVRLLRLEATPLSVPTFDPFVIATGRVDATRSVLVRAELEAGGARAVGYGEASCLPPVTVEDQPDALAHLQKAGAALAGAALRLEPGFTDLHALLDAQLGHAPVSRAGAEVALLDAIARLAGQPLHALLSGRPGPAPALRTDITIPILPLARMAELASEWWARGFRSFKVKVGKDLQADLAALEAMHRAAPAAAFRPDANGGYTAAQALAYAEGAARLGARLECFEQPCDTAGLAEVTRALKVPVLADESVKTLADFQAVAGAVGGVNLKIAKSGSLLRALAIGQAAQERGLALMVGGMVETRLGMTAASHLAAALGSVAFPDLDTAWLLREDPFEGGYAAQGPDYTLPDAPGLAIAPAVA